MTFGIVTGAGLAALVVAMGIGRFAFTPILPMMQQDLGVSVAAGGWLASANYLGYLLGALSVTRLRLRAPAAIRFGLITIAITTLAMSFTGRFGLWAVLRMVAGSASAPADPQRRGVRGRRRGDRAGGRRVPRPDAPSRPLDDRMDRARLHRADAHRAGVA